MTMFAGAVVSWVGAAGPRRVHLLDPGLPPVRCRGPQAGGRGTAGEDGAGGRVSADHVRPAPELQLGGPVPAEEPGGAERGAAAGVPDPLHRGAGVHLRYRGNRHHPSHPPVTN